MADFKAVNFTLQGSKVKAGDNAPDFKLVDVNSAVKTLKDYAGKVKVISVFPSIDTGVCEMQTKHFNAKYGTNGKVVVLNVSVDLPFAFSRWCDANKYDNVIALSDYRDNNFGKSYGVLMDPYMTLFRSVFVLDKNDKIVLASYNSDVGQPVDFKTVEATVEKLIK